MAILGVGALPPGLPDVASQLCGGLREVAASSARRRCPPLGWRFGVARSGGLKCPPTTPRSLPVSRGGGLGGEEWRSQVPATAAIAARQSGSGLGGEECGQFSGGVMARSGGLRPGLWRSRIRHAPATFNEPAGFRPIQR